MRGHLLRVTIGMVAFLSFVSRASYFHFSSDSAGTAIYALNTGAKNVKSLKTEANESAQPSESLTFAVEDSLFYVSPGDQLRLRWWGIGEGSANLSVNTNWELVIPDMGALNVRGATLKMVREKVSNLLRSHIKVRMLDLQLIKTAPAQVQVTGLIPHPGVYDIDPGMRLSEVLKLADFDVGLELRRRQLRSPPGPNDNYRLSSLRRILVVRGSGRDSLWCDLAKAYNGGTVQDDPRLFTGDQVKLLAQGPVISVSGDAPFAGNAEIIPEEPVDSLVKVLGLSRLPEGAAVVTASGRTPVHPGTRLPVDCVLLEMPPVSYANRPGFAWVFGYVKHPGVYQLRAGMTASDLVAAAGGGRSSEDSTVVLSIKRGWGSLKFDTRHWEEASQYPEVREALTGYLLQMQGTYSDPRTPLQGGDTVIVREADQVVWVGGAVERQGFVPWMKGASVDDYVAKASGYTSAAWSGNVKVYDAYTGLQIGEKQAIRPGAMILVPESRHMYMDQWISLTSTIISAIVSLATFYVVAK